MRKTFKRFRRRKDEQPEEDQPAVLIVIQEAQPCALCGDDTDVKALQENSGIIWICTDAHACVRRQNFHVVD